MESAKRSGVGWEPGLRKYSEVRLGVAKLKPPWGL